MRYCYWGIGTGLIIKPEFFQTGALSVLLYGYTVWTLKMLGKKSWSQTTQDDVLNKSWKQHPTKQQLYGHLLPISQTIHCKGSKNKLIGNILKWTTTLGHTSVYQSEKSYIHQLYVDTGWITRSNGRERERGREHTLMMMKYSNREPLRIGNVKPSRSGRYYFFQRLRL